MTTSEEIRMHSLDIDGACFNLQVLLEAICDKIDSGAGDPVKALGEICCFVECSMHQVKRVSEHSQHIAVLAKGGA